MCIFGEHSFIHTCYDCDIQDSTNTAHFFQAEDLVANFFPKKLLELDHFLKVS